MSTGFHFQMFLVSGGYGRDGWIDGGSDWYDSTDIFDTSLGSWATSETKLPQPMSDLRATNINDRVLIFGIDILIRILQIQENNCRWIP